MITFSFPDQYGKYQMGTFVSGNGHAYWVARFFELIHGVYPIKARS